jgi:hypothetical protein
MKTQLLKNGRKWSVYGALTAAMAYTALTFMSQPAYAGTCTTSRCQTLSGNCTAVCAHHGGVGFFTCPVNGTTHAACFCNDPKYKFFLPC